MRRWCALALPPFSPDRKRVQPEVHPAYPPAIDDQRGFLLVSILLLMVLAAVTVLAVNHFIGSQQQVSVNHQASVRKEFSRYAAFQQGLWLLLSDPCYRATGESFSFDAKSFVRSIANSGLKGQEDAVVITVLSEGGTRSSSRGYRYFCASLQGEIQPNPGTRQNFDKPEGMAVDAGGVLYIADKEHHRIVRRDSRGNMSLFAGRQDDGFSGDGGPATSARLKKPTGVATDPYGNVYIADKENHRIRRVDTSGIITTVAGTGDSDFSGDGGAATSADLDKPHDVAFHPGTDSLYISDTENSCIRRVNAAGIISTIAGKPGKDGYKGDGGLAVNGKLDEPEGIFVTDAGVLYIADTKNAVIRRVDTSGIITTVAGSGKKGFKGDGGPATSARLEKPSAVAVDRSGNLYIADTKNDRIRMVCASGGIIRTIAGGGKASGPDWAVMTELKEPAGVATIPTSLSGKTLFFSDTGKHTPRSLSFQNDPSF